VSSAARSAWTPGTAENKDKWGPVQSVELSDCAYVETCKLIARWFSDCMALNAPLLDGIAIPLKTKTMEIGMRTNYITLSPFWVADMLYSYTVIEIQC
jgi:hypothetical protein